MEIQNFYLILVIVLFALAISDLIVGVTNDAVNFLNSAIGSKAANFKLIMLIAALGVFIGASFSGGMMEIARKGIFHPQMFYFSEIMIIFFAVMITDVILLDTFNTFGLPTSTTVSLVFELLGASVAIAFIKVMDVGSGNVTDYINSSKALIIIFGILLSVFVAFFAGAVIQWLSRLLFSFKLSRSIKYFGSVWGGIAITAITYFILVDGIKGSSFANYTFNSGIILSDWINNNIKSILLISLFAWAGLLQLFHMLFKFNIPRLIVLVGTFALAMAFAGNDLVNFIGVPLAGYESFKIFMANPTADPNSFLMSGLTAKVQTPLYFLLFAGLVMVVTLYVSKKAKKVIKTSIDLSRQQEGEERFGANIFSKSLVRAAISINASVKSVIPNAILNQIDRQFEVSRAEIINMPESEKPAFDMIRASVNLVVASILISMGTTFKLPLSTTYVTFMVAMGTSLADRAWGRDSAVYRLSGVVSVILGWFFTAFAAFAVSFFIAFVVYWGGFIAIFIFIGIGIYLIMRTQSSSKKERLIIEEKAEVKESLGLKDLYEENRKIIIESISTVNDVFGDTIESLGFENLNVLKKARKKVKGLNARTKELKDTIQIVVRKLDNEAINSAYHYAQSLDFLREIARCADFIVEPSLNHIDNNHKSMGEMKMNDLNKLKISMNEYLFAFGELVSGNKFENLEAILTRQQKLLIEIDGYTKAQIKRLSKLDSGKKNAKLLLDIMGESKTLLLHSANLIKAHRDLAIDAGIYHN